MKHGCGHPMGPLTLCDFIGLDVLYAIGDSLYEEFKQTEYAPPPLLKRMVASGPGAARPTGASTPTTRRRTGAGDRMTTPRNRRSTPSRRR